MMITVSSTLWRCFTVSRVSNQRSVVRVHPGTSRTGGGTSGTIRCPRAPRGYPHCRKITLRRALSAILHADTRSSNFPLGFGPAPGCSEKLGTCHAIAMPGPPVANLDDVRMITWNAALRTHVPALDDNINIGLDIRVVSLEGESIQAILQSTQKPEKYDRGNEYLQGRIDQFAFDLPDGFEPAAVFINDRNDQGSAMFRKGGDFEYLFIRDMVLTPLAPINSSNGNSGRVTFTANSYISVYQDERLFVRDDAWSNPVLRQNKEINKLQEQELQAIRGEGDNATKAHLQPRTDGDRIYRFAKYDDLGGNPNDEKNIRPILGGTEFPYPRRLDTNRGYWPNTSYEKPPTEASVFELWLSRLPLLNRLVNRTVKAPWVPNDDNFDEDKARGFVGNAVLGVLPSVLTQLDALFDGNPLLQPIERLLQLFKLAPGNAFDDLAEVLSLYDKKQVVKTMAQGDAPSIAIPSAGSSRDFGGNLPRFNAKVDIKTGKKRGKDTSGGLDLLKYDVPRSIDRRLQTWDTDEEFGRLFLAGHNPVVIQAVNSNERLLKLLRGSSIRDSDIKDLLEGKSFAELAVASDAPRLFIVDYWDFYECLPESNGAWGRVPHAGRAVLFKRDDGYLVPVAIELVSSKNQPATVYTPKSPWQVWQVAKAVFMSTDSGYHQLYSHFVRTHACAEPYLISLRRQLSPTHPIFRLMIPHFRYTLPINAAARGLLVNADGVIEQNFSSGHFSMALSSKVYEKRWEFKNEGVYADLKQRGFISDNGELLLEDYPYAQDGLDIWNAFQKYFTAYVNYYYADDGEILEDKQLQNWWKDAREEGHPDIKKGWIELHNRANLVDICATMAWVSSAHHAAVNFGQYDYSGWPVTHASLCRKPAPAPGTDDWKELTSATGTKFEQLLLTWLSPPAIATKVMSTVKLLSSHSKDEQYLTSDTQEWLPLVS
eukprot:GHRR01002715.1.p1 GENE.GHRR01002715.1~~GHRR01002715.1.p1  ORF type:complete len:939 (-),score=220.64 GHRR01002715.1:462-3278(-)